MCYAIVLVLEGERKKRPAEVSGVGRLNEDQQCRTKLKSCDARWRRYHMKSNTPADDLNLGPDDRTFPRWPMRIGQGHEQWYQEATAEPVAADSKAVTLTGPTC